MELQGFLVSIHTIHENILEVEVDTSGLKWDAYQKLVEVLEDHLHDIDRDYSVKSKLVRGRTLKARYKRISLDDRRRRLRFSPLPSKYSNLLKNLRSYVYTDLIPSTCFCLEKVAKRKLYFLPKGMAPYLLEVIDKMNTETLADANKEIEQFRQGNEYFSLIQLLNRHGLDTNVLSKASFVIGDFSVDILPVDFGYSIDMDDFYAQQTRMKHKKGLDALRRQITEKHQEYVAEVMRDIMRRLTPLIVAESYRGMRVKKKLGRLIEVCEGSGLNAISEEVIKPLLEICSARADKREALTEKHFGVKSLYKGVENAMRELKTPFLEDDNGSRGEDSRGVTPATVP